MWNIISAIFGTLDDVARVIGWIVMVGAVLWFIHKQRVQDNAYKEALANRDARFVFERALQAKYPDKYRTYDRLKDGCRMRGENIEIHWESIAIEAGVSQADYRALMGSDS